jgi:hypothetical protein
MPACVGGKSTRITLRSMLFMSNAETDSRSSFIGIANVQCGGEVSSESFMKHFKGIHEAIRFGWREGGCTSTRT